MTARELRREAACVEAAVALVLLFSIFALVYALSFDAARAAQAAAGLH